MRHLEMGHIVLLIVGLAVMISAVIYVAHRTSQWLGLLPVASYIIFFLFFLSIVGAMGSSWYLNGTKPIEHWVVIFGCYASGFMLTLILVTLFVDIVTFPLHDIKIVWKGIITYGVTALLTLFCSVSAMRPVVKEIHVPIRKLDHEIRLVQLSDMHIGHFRGVKWLRGVVGHVNSCQPDAVVITGDIFESYYNLTDEVVEELKNISAPIFFVAGNHDKYVNLLRIKDMLRKAGVHVLENELERFGDLQIAGTGLEQVADVIDAIGINPDLPCILLRHYPNGVEEAINHGVDLVLAGHTHGGQLFPVTLINRFAFDYNRGLYKVGDGYIYTSSGAGTTGPPLRFETKCEITLVTLVPAGLQ